MVFSFEGSSNSSIPKTVRSWRWVSVKTCLKRRCEALDSLKIFWVISFRRIGRREYSDERARRTNFLLNVWIDVSARVAPFCVSPSTDAEESEVGSEDDCLLLRRCVGSGEGGGGDSSSRDMASDRLLRPRGMVIFSWILHAQALR